MGSRDVLEVSEYDYCQNHRKLTYKLCGRNTELLLLNLVIHIESFKL